jgi:hypothetical protein
MEQLLTIIALMILFFGLGFINLHWYKFVRHVKNEQHFDSKARDKSAKKIGLGSLFVGFGLGCLMVVIRIFSDPSQEINFLIYLGFIVFSTIGWPAILLFFFSITTITLEKRHGEDDLN